MPTSDPANESTEIEVASSSVAEPAALSAEATSVRPPSVGTRLLGRLLPPPPTAGSGGTSRTKEIVEGLDRREHLLALVGVAFDIAVSLTLYFASFRHSKNLTTRHDALTFLLAALVGVVILILGTAFRRRALLGFASFIVGFELLSFGSISGMIYLFFGGWLIVRALRKQRAGRTPMRNAAAPPSTRPQRTAPLPSASKRYTPPRKARSAAKRR